MSLDSLRDRITPLVFNLLEAEKIFIKTKDKDREFELQFQKDAQGWKSNQINFNPVAAEKFMQTLHDLKIAEFVPEKDQQLFTGANMVIIKSFDDKLIFQLNWGPEYKKNYTLVRSQNSPKVFALDKQDIEKLNVDSLVGKGN